MSLKATWIKIIKSLAIIVTGQILQNTTKEKKASYMEIYFWRIISKINFGKK